MRQFIERLTQQINSREKSSFLNEHELSTRPNPKAHSTMLPSLSCLRPRPRYLLALLIWAIFVGHPGSIYGFESLQIAYSTNLMGELEPCG
ncbi:MAG: hypothetical protein ACK5PS_12435 [Desulfopila sp.]